MSTTNKSVDKSVRFWNAFARRYARSPIKDQEAYQKKLTLTQRYLRADGDMLEFGCGTGSTALLHSTYVKDVLAIDNAHKMIDIANQKLADSGFDNVVFECTTVLELPHPPESFQAILGLNVLHLVDEWQATIQRCYELLEPDGVFVTGTACLKGKMGFFSRFLLPTLGKLGFVPKLQLFDTSTLTKAMTDVGFEIIYHNTLNQNDTNQFIIAQK